MASIAQRCRSSMSSSSSSFLAIMAKKTERTEIETRGLDLAYCVFRTELTDATCSDTLPDQNCLKSQTHSVKNLTSDSYQVWKVMMLKARWGGKRSLFPRYPAGFGLTRPEPAHPAPPAAHPGKRIEVCKSLKTLSRTPQAHLCKACWNPKGAHF